MERNERAHLLAGMLGGRARPGLRPAWEGALIGPWVTSPTPVAWRRPPRENRNRVVDFWRVLAILMVVCGHWLAVSIWVWPDGSTDLLNSLEWVPYAAWLTWLFQVMPVFFLAGGYANSRALGQVSVRRAVAPGLDHPAGAAALHPGDPPARWCGWC